MKFLPLVFALIPFIAFSKTRLEDYYVGFEISTIVDHDNIDGESFDLSSNIPLESSSVLLNIAFSDIDIVSDSNGSSSAASRTWIDLGIDYFYHFENVDGFVPFVGIGLNYADLDANDDVFWNLYLGLEFSVSDQLTLLPKLRLYQGFDDFDDTELEASFALTYWLSDNHGLSLGYTHNSLGETDYIGLQYLYSWE
jgi:hypothetical protein